MFANNKTCIEIVKLGDFFVFELPYTYISIGDVLFRRRFVTGDVLLRRRSVTETFCMETFCREDVLCGDVLYVRPLT
jgi:hypothetical protein